MDKRVDVLDFSERDGLGSLCFHLWQLPLRSFLSGKAYLQMKMRMNGVTKKSMAAVGADCFGFTLRFAMKKSPGETVRQECKPQSRKAPKIEYYQGGMQHAGCTVAR